MYFTVPAKFKNNYVFCAILFSEIGFDFKRSRLREKLKEPAFEALYEETCAQMRDASPDAVAMQFKLKFIVENEKFEIQEYGNGHPVYIKSKGTSRIYMTPALFYYLPEGILEQNEIISTLDKFVAYINEANARKNFFMKKPRINPTPLNQLNICELEKNYNLCINIHTKSRTPITNRWTYGRMRQGSEKSARIVNLFYQKESEELILIRDLKKFMKSIYYCHNADLGCRFVFSKKSEYENHIRHCKTVDQIRETPKIHQKEFSYSQNLIDKAIRHGLISKYPSNENFIFYDIECTLKTSNVTTANTVVLSSHKLVSIAANSFINGVHKSKVWVIKNDDEKSQLDLVNDFVDFCIDAKNQVPINDEVSSALSALKEMQHNLHIKDFYKEEVSELIGILQPFEALPIFGYNNIKYDNRVIIEFLIKVLDGKGVKTSDIRLLKKSTRYFSVQFAGLSMKDLMNFNIPVSLDEYLKTWTKTESKLIYPYEYFASIDDIRSCTVFPDRDAFGSRLKGPVDENLYVHCKNIFDQHRSLNPSDSEYWENFEDYLKFYNLSDVVPASKALIAQFSTYRKNFGLSPMQFLGLPGYAAAVMFKMYDNTCPSIFTFPDSSSATGVFRKQIIGGLCNVLHRHLTTNDEPDAAYYAMHNMQGERWKTIKFYDVNAMYPSTFKAKFPCGRGFEWTLEKHFLHKKIMTNEKISLGSIEWLDYVQNTDKRLKQIDGSVVRLISGWGSKEFKIGPYQVDGYAKVGKMQYFYEFNGCFFHDCLHCDSNNLAKNEEERVNFFKSIPNSEVIIMTGCQWNQIWNKISWKSSISPHLTKRNIRQDVMLDNFKRNELYGFALIDIEATPDAQKFLDINWPPILVKSEINFTDLPEWMQQNASTKTFPRKTIVQGMFANEILLHTDLIFFYMRHGFKVTKIHKFFEFEGRCCFKKVHDAIYQARVEATLEKDEMKAMAVKLVSNAMYGRMLQVMEKTKV